MSKLELNPQQVVTGEVRLSYVNVFEPRKINETDKDAKYSLTILIPKNTADGQATIKRINAAIKAAAEKGMAKHFNGRMPANLDAISTLRDGDTYINTIGDAKRDTNPEVIGHMFMRLSSKLKPKVLDASGNPILDPANVYSGMFGKVSLTCYAYTSGGSKGISAVLNNIMVTRDGEPLTTMLSGEEFEIN